MFNADNYTWALAWSTEDNQFVATVLEFPSLSWLSDSPTEAYDGLVVLVKDIIANND